MTAPRRKGPSVRRPARARRERSAGGVVVRYSGADPLFLLIRDSYGHWGFPKGHLERDELPEVAARREVLEETGLPAVELVGSIAIIDWQFRFRGTLIHKNCEFFLMETASASTRPQKSEGITACKWAAFSDARRLLAYENARQVLLRAQEMITMRARPAGA